MLALAVCIPFSACIVLGQIFVPGSVGACASRPLGLIGLAQSTLGVFLTVVFWFSVMSGCCLFLSALVRGYLLSHFGVTGCLLTCQAFPVLCPASGASSGQPLPVVSLSVAFSGRALDVYTACMLVCECSRWDIWCSGSFDASLLSGFPIMSAGLCPLPTQVVPVVGLWCACVAPCLCSLGG